MPDTVLELKRSIRDVPDFPKQGILFKDITTLLKDGALFHTAVDLLVDHYRDRKIQKIVGIESRGFIIGSPVAYRLGAGIVPIRKKGKLPAKTISTTYQLEYGTDTLEMHEDAIAPGEKVLIIDDLLATGGTAQATAGLVRKVNADIVGLAFLIELSFLEGRKNLKGYDVFTLMNF